MQARLVIFDMDGVLILSKRAYLAAFRKELAPYGIRYAERMLDEYVADPKNVNAHWAVVQQALPEGKKGDAKKVAGRVERFLTKNWKRYCTSPKGAAKAIERLKKAGIKVAVATHANEGFALKALDYYGLKGFDLVVTRESGFSEKSAALGFVMRKLKAKPSETVYVGDVMADVLVAKRAGCGFAGFVGGFNTRKQLESAGAEKVATTMRSLASALLQSPAQRRR